MFPGFQEPQPINVVENYDNRFRAIPLVFELRPQRVDAFRLRGIDRSFRKLRAISPICGTASGAVVTLASRVERRAILAERFANLLHLVLHAHAGRQFRDEPSTSCSAPLKSHGLKSRTGTPSCSNVLRARFTKEVLPEPQGPKTPTVVPGRRVRNLLGEGVGATDSSEDVFRGVLIGLSPGRGAVSGRAHNGRTPLLQ